MTVPRPWGVWYWKLLDYDIWAYGEGVTDMREDSRLNIVDHIVNLQYLP